MEASKLTISGETLKAHMSTLSKARKTELRREAIIAYIKSKPAGSIIKTSSFQAIGGFNTEANAHAHLVRMVRDGLIGRMHAEGSKRFYTWWIVEPDFQPESKVEESESPDSLPVDTVEPDHDQELKEVKSENVENFASRDVGADICDEIKLRLAAKDFAWTHNSDSLRDFIGWYIR